MESQEKLQTPDPRERTLRAQVERGIEALLKEMQNGQSERLQEYLAFTARFHKYSLHNQMLIYLQYPQATRVAGYRKWQELGYQVKRGEQGIRILAPRPHERIDEATGETKEIVGFVAVSVFDVSQLVNVEEKPLPVFFVPLADDQPALYARLAQVVREDGITLNEEHSREAQGYSQGKRVSVRAGMDSRNGVFTLIHEYAHELLHWSAQGRTQAVRVKECHAEAVSYIVAHHFGLHNPFSADYLQAWGNTPKELMAELEIVCQTAAYIIDCVEKVNWASALAEESPAGELTAEDHSV